MIIYYVFTFLLGLIIGSFLNVCIYRIPKGESIALPPSHCTGCGTRLTPLDLVPVLSYVFLKGKCRHCGAKISIKYPMIELITAVVYISLFHKYGLKVDFIAAAYLMSILIAVFFIDLKHYEIPNGLVIAGIIGGLPLIAYNVLYPVWIYGDRNWWNPVVGAFAGSGILFIVALIGLAIYKGREAMGMGDVKLFVAIGIFLGWKMTIFALFAAIITSAITSIILMILKIKGRKDEIPLGPFIVIGTYIAFMWGWDLFNLWYSSSFANLIPT